jgi:hypothetical protein
MKGKAMKKTVEAFTTKLRPVAELEQWLRTECRCHTTQRVRVTIESEVWEGCAYTQTLRYGKGIDIVVRGLKTTEDIYHTYRILCVGRLPLVYKPFGRKYPRNNTCFIVKDSPWEWYVAGYMPSDKLTEATMRHHPFGANFVLAPWDVPDTRIDTGALRPYVRSEMQVEPLSGVQA